MGLSEEALARRRCREILAANAARELIPTPKMEWEVQRDIRLERDALRLRVAELEGMLDEVQDEIADLKAVRPRRKRRTA